MKGGIAFVVKVRTYLRRYRGLSSELHAIVPYVEYLNMGSVYSPGVPDVGKPWNSFVTNGTNSSFSRPFRQSEARLKASTRLQERESAKGARFEIGSANG